MITSSGFGDWSVDDSHWEIGKPTAQWGPSGTHSGDSVVGTVINGEYAANTTTRLISPPFVVPSAVDNPRLNFWHWYSFANAYSGDGGKVQISTDSGQTWADLDTYWGNQSGIGRKRYSDFLVRQRTLAFEPSLPNSRQYPKNDNNIPCGSFVVNGVNPSTIAG